MPLDGGMHEPEREPHLEPCPACGRRAMDLHYGHHPVTHQLGSMKLCLECFWVEGFRLDNGT